MNFFIIIITVFAALGGFLFGFDSSVINGANIALKDFFGANDVQLGLAVSLCLLGSAVGALVSGRLADKIGRVKCMMIASIMFTASAVGSGLPLGIADFIAWRVLGGIGIGIASIIAPIYIAEIAPESSRGQLGSVQQFAIVIGIFVALLSNYLIVRTSGSASAVCFLNFEAWRVMFWVEIIPAVLYFFGSLFLPESPRYLISKGMLKEAGLVLSKLGANVQEKTASIQDSFKNQQKTSLKDLFEIKNGKKVLSTVFVVGLGIAVLQQFVGINVIFYYGTMLWESAGFGQDKAFLTSLISSGINLVMTIVAIALIDKIGRKPLLVIGSIGMTLTLGTLGMCFFCAADGKLSGGNGIAALIAANLYVAFFAATWGPVMWVMLGEMFSNRIRAIAISICGLAQWMANFIVSWSFPVLTGESGIGVGPTYMIYTAFAAFSAFFVIKFIKETKGKALEEM